jgi:hypothetical protein
MDRRLPIVRQHFDPDSTMAKPGAGPPVPLPPPTTIETARYIRDLTESLRKMAIARDLKLLAHLLGLALIEAKAQLKSGQDQDTKLPD